MTHVLVAGGAGFVGSNCLKHWLRKYPYRFTVVDKMNYASTELPQHPRLSVVHADLSQDYSSVQALLESIDFTVIINFAAESCVDRSFQEPVYFSRNNIMCTHNLLEYYRTHTGVTKFIHVSTDEVYGDSQQDADESSPLRPTNPYSATKAAADLMIEAYMYSYGLDVTVIRPNNLYGPGQYPEKIIPISIQSMIRGEKIPIHGSGSNLRSFLHVDDLASAMDLIWHKGQPGIYNVGTQQETSVLAVVEMVVRAFGKDLTDSVEFVQDRGYNDKRYSCNFSKIQSLGWCPKIDLREGIEELVELSKSTSE